MKKKLISSLKAMFLIMAASIFSQTFAAPDLTIVGFFEAEGGIGKVPLTILETLGDEISTNFVCTTHKANLGQELTSRAIACINNQDSEDGKVALLTDLISTRHGRSADKMPKNSIVKLAYSMLETTQIPTMWVKTLNEEFDAVVVPDIYVSNMYQESGVTIPIFVLPLPMVLDPYLEKNYETTIASKPFIFADMSANKNPVVLIEAFAKAFNKDLNVVLFLRAGVINRSLINKTIKKHKLKTVVIEDGKIPLTQFIDRLLVVNCFVNLSRGEGFSYIPRECLALGLPVIITDNTASGTICKSGFVRSVPSNIKAPANQHYMNLFGEQCGEQFDCQVDDVVVALKDVYNNYPKYIEKAHQGREWVKQYDCKDLKLKALYQMLVKPKLILLGEENTITEDALITNSVELYQKYLQVVN